MKTFSTHESGFIALISILMLSAVLLVTTLSIAQFGIANRFFILNLEQKAASKNLAEACVHIARINAYNDPTYTVVPADNDYIKIAGSGCEIYSATRAGNDTTVSVIASSSDSFTNVVVTINNTDGSFLSWEERGSF